MQVYLASKLGTVTDDGLTDVSVLTIGEAKGHGIFIDETTLRQFITLTLGKSVKGYLRHAGWEDRTGKEIAVFSGFYLDTEAGSVRARRCEFLRAFRASVIPEEQRAFQTIMEMARKAPESFGLSIVFDGDPVVKLADGSEMPADPADPKLADMQLFARITKVNSIDFVDSPAANPSLFSMKDQDPAPKADPFASFTSALDELNKGLGGVVKRMDAFDELVGKLTRTSAEAPVEDKPAEKPAKVPPPAEEKPKEEPAVAVPPPAKPEDEEEDKDEMRKLRSELASMRTMLSELAKGRPAVAAASLASTDPKVQLSAKEKIELRNAAVAEAMKADPTLSRQVAVLRVGEKHPELF